AAARGARRSRLAGARRGMDLQRDTSPPWVGLGAADRFTAGAARARRADAVLTTEAMGGGSRAAAAANRRDRSGGGPLQARSPDGPRRGAGGAAGDGRGGDTGVRAQAGEGASEHPARGGRYRNRQDPRLSRAGLAVGGAGEWRGMGVDLHQGASAPAGRRRPE